MNNSDSKIMKPPRSSKKWKWEGRESIKEMELENSFCGTIEERDEMEEPEMQDISFSKDLDSEEKNWGPRNRKDDILPSDKDSIFSSAHRNSMTLEDMENLGRMDHILGDETRDLEEPPTEALSSSNRG